MVRDIWKCPLTDDEKVLASFIYLFSFEHILEKGKNTQLSKIWWCVPLTLSAWECKSCDNQTGQRGSSRAPIWAVRMPSYSAVLYCRSEYIFLRTHNNILLSDFPFSLFLSFTSRPKVKDLYCLLCYNGTIQMRAVCFPVFFLKS